MIYQQEWNKKKEETYTRQQMSLWIEKIQLFPLNLNMKKKKIEWPQKSMENR